MSQPVASTVSTLLARARSLGIERLDAQLLIGHALKQPRSWLLAHDDEALPDAAARLGMDLLARRAQGEPVAYLTGHRDFHGLELQVTPDVLVPRPDTETLVDWALERLAAGVGAAGVARVVDLGTGSGAIALAVKHGWPQADVLATDLSEPALQVARANATRLGLALRFAHGGWWAAPGTEACRWHLVLSNPPYIAGDDPHLPALRHEPRSALTPGGDGFGALREIVAGAAARMADDGWLLLEHGHDQAPALRSMLCAAGFVDVQTRQDLAGRDRCTGGRRPGNRDKSVQPA